MNCLIEEKTNLECELRQLNESLHEELCSRVVNENELSEVTEDLKEEKEEKAKLFIQLDALKCEMAEKCDEIDRKQRELGQYESELSTIKMSLSSTTSDLETMKEKMGMVSAEKQESDKNVIVYQERLAALQCTLDQEVSSLKFQLSSEVLKYDDEIMVRRLLLESIICIFF